MIKHNEQYYPSINILGEWYFLIKKEQKIIAVPRRPKNGLSIDKATSIENEYKARVCSEIPTIVSFANKLLNEPLEEIKPQNEQERHVIQQLINKIKSLFKQQ